MPAPDRPPAPADADADAGRTRAATRPVLWFSLVLLAGLWFSVLSPPWPLPLLSGVLALVAIVLGILALVRLRRARIGGAMVVLVVVGLLFAAGMVFLSSVQALMWPLYADFHACLDRALTHRAERACLADLQNVAQNQLFDLVRQSSVP